MKLMLKVLSTFWLCIAMATMPLQAVAAEGAAEDPCQMHGMHGDSGAADEGCPNCNDHNCDSEGCNHSGCASFQLPLAKLTQVYAPLVVHPATLAQTIIDIHTSRTTPPLLRPPA
jgi:hypothetical protein